LSFLKTCLWYVYSSVAWGAVFFSFKFYCTFSYYYTVCGCFLLHAHLHSHHFEKHDFSCIIFSIPNNMNYNFLEVHLQKLRALHSMILLASKSIWWAALLFKKKCVQISSALRVQNCNDTSFSLNTKCKYMMMSLRHRLLPIYGPRTNCWQIALFYTQCDDYIWILFFCASICIYLLSVTLSPNK